MHLQSNQNTKATPANNTSIQHNTLHGHTFKIQSACGLGSTALQPKKAQTDRVRSSNLQVKHYTKIMVIHTTPKQRQ